MDMRIEESKGILIIVPELKQIDVNNSLRFRTDLEKHLGDKNKVILDLQCVNFMDSTGLGIIITALRDINEREGYMYLCNPAPAVKVLFEMVRLSHIAPIYNNRDEAVEKMLN